MTLLDARSLVSPPGSDRSRQDVLRGAERSPALGGPSDGLAAHAGPISVTAALRWPCLARALCPTAGATSESILDAHITLSGERAALIGRVEVAFLNGHEPSALGSSAGAHLLADLAISGSLETTERWIHLTLGGGEPTRGTLTIDLTLPRGMHGSDSDAPRVGTPNLALMAPGSPGFGTIEAGAGDRIADGIGAGLLWHTDGPNRPWHVRTSLFRWLAVPGGRYGLPAVRCTIAAPTLSAIASPSTA